MSVKKEQDDKVKGEEENKKDAELLQSVIKLETEKDFIELAKKTGEKIANAKKPNKFTFAFLKNSIELLAPSLESNNIKDLENEVTVTFNNKLKDERTKKKMKKPMLNSGKGIEKNQEKIAIDEYGGNEDYEEEEDEYEEDYFM